MKTEIYLVRHGQTEWNLEGRYQGSGDSPLTELGIKQANALSKHLENIHFDAIFCSPAGRAQNTARILKANRNIDLITINDFQEIQLASWEGRYYEDTKAESPQLYHGFWKSPDLFIPDEGESFTDVGNRTYPALLKIVNEFTGKRILVVSHAVALLSILNKIENRPLDKFWDKKLYQTSLSVIEFENNKFVIKKFGDTEHLRGIVSTKI